MADGDVPNGSTCGRNGCGHKASFHADGDAGQNTGKCSFMGCKCTAFQAKTAAASAGGGGGGGSSTARVELGTTIVGPAAAEQVSADGPAFTAVLIQEGVDTQDGRHIAPNALTWRDLPLPLMVLTSTGPGGHEGAQIGARIDSIERRPGNAPGSYDLVATGHLDTGQVGTEAARLIGNQTLRGVSGDLVDCESTVTILAEDDEGWPTEILETVTSGVLAAATVCPIPAFAGCTIALDTTDDAATADVIPPPEQEPALLASGFTLPAFHVQAECLPCQRGGGHLTASGGPMAPPAAWFTDPGLEQVTALTVTDDGRIYGHLAEWGTCHIGYDGQCVNPPYSATNYAGYRLGLVRTADGQDVRTGTVTLGGGHADHLADANAARAHYDNTGAVIADVACGEDTHGIWVAGALRPDVTELQVRQLRACGGLSGDWRQVGSGLELVAALAVNVPGFPIARVASGQPVALVAAGARSVARHSRPWTQDLQTVRRELDAELAQVRADRAMRRIRR